MFLFGLEASLADDVNYHAFCCLLGHFKVNYQVTLTICSLNICIQLLLSSLMSSVWLNSFLLIGNFLYLKIIYNYKMLVFIISILTTRPKKIEKLHLHHIKALFSLGQEHFFILDAVFYEHIFLLSFENCLEEV